MVHKFNFDCRSSLPISYLHNQKNLDSSLRIIPYGLTSASSTCMHNSPTTFLLQWKQPVWKLTTYLRLLPKQERVDFINCLLVCCTTLPVSRPAQHNSVVSLTGWNYAAALVYTCPSFRKFLNIFPSTEVQAVRMRTDEVTWGNL
jgi:hypothetical protein